MTAERADVLLAFLGELTEETAEAKEGHEQVEAAAEPAGQPEAAKDGSTETPPAA
jgi:hypothetical protein